MPVRRFAARILLGCASGYVACNYYGPDDLPGYGGGGQGVSGTPGSGGEISGGTTSNGGTSGAPTVEGGAGGFLNAEGGSAGDAGGQSGGAPAVEGGAPNAGATATGGSGGVTGGAAGTAGSEATGGAGVTPCLQSQPDVTFNFDSDQRIKNVYKPSPTNWRGNWVRSTYDSTSKGNEPTDPQDNENLAALGSSGWEGGIGSGGTTGSMRQNIAFHGGYDEYLGVIFPYELDGSTAMLADLSGRTMTAQVQLGTTPRANCKFSAAAFSRSGSAYDKVIGEHVDLEVGTWKAISFDTDLSADRTKVISIGIEIATKCTLPIQGPTSSQITVFIDAISLACDPTVSSSLR